MPTPITLTSPLPAADLLFESMTTSAGLSMLGETQLNLLSPNADIRPEDLLGKPVTIRVETADGEGRFFNGYVTRFGLGVHRGRYYAYQATVNAWPWFLTCTADCRIFQDETVPDIVTKVFQDHGVAKFEFKLFRSYRKWVYCVQYRETDYNFVARLLEHEGIYWYFEHEEGAHKLVLVDSSAAHDAAPGCESLPYIEVDGHASPDTESISSWNFSREVRSGKVALTSYDFERPSTDLKVNADKDRSFSQSDHEIFDFQGDYAQAADGTQWADDRMDELQTPFEMLRGTSNAHGIEAGRLLSLTRHPRADQNAQYLITGVSIHAWVDGYEAGDEPGGYRCDFVAIPAAQQFRPSRETQRPLVQGPQTAVVVGPAGEELFTDKYGRVKVQFFWDRQGQKNEKSSCWVRVSHPWAGKNFGMVHVPRIGQEVVIHFLEGDPDQPLITGRVYNAEQMPPWDLPANATQSGILTRSSKGGAYGNANAIRFEDRKGAEQLWMHAEKDQLNEVENDEVSTVGHDRTETVGHDETIKIGANRTISVGACETATVALQRTHAVGINETIAIGAAQEVAIGAAQLITVGLSQITKVGKSISVDAGDSITLTTGAASITMKNDGTIVIKGKDIAIVGSGQIDVKASSDVVIKGSKVNID